MGEILVPGGRPLDPRKPIPGQPKQVSGAPVYEDAHYLVLKKTPVASQADALQVPFQIAMIGVVGINATVIAPRVGKDKFLSELKGFRKVVDELLDGQKVIAMKMDEPAPPPEPQGVKKGVDDFMAKQRAKGNIEDES